MNGLHKGQNTSKNYVTKNPELFQDTLNLAEDFDSLICLAYTTAKMVTIFKNVIPCFWQRYSWKLIWSDLNLILLTKLILKSFKKKKKESSSCHALLWSCFHALLYFDLAMLFLTKSAPKTKIFSFTINSPRFGDKKEKFTIQSLFTITIHPLLFMTLFTPNFCLFKGGCPLCLEQVLVQVFFPRESFPL